MSGASVKCSKRREERHTQVRPNGRVSAFRCYQPPASITTGLRRRRFALAQAGQKRDPDLETAGNLADVSLNPLGKEHRAHDARVLTFSGVTMGSNTGNALTATNGNKSAIGVWRINGTTGYKVAAHQ
jgi:hypothetical protein